jgi:hypothetical protein
VVHHLDFALDNDWIIYDGPKEWLIGDGFSFRIPASWEMEQLVLYLDWIMDNIWIIYGWANWVDLSDQPQSSFPWPAPLGSPHRISHVATNRPKWGRGIIKGDTALEHLIYR